MFTSLEEIQAYIEDCEQKRLALENGEVWPKAYLPTTGATERQGNHQDKVILSLFKLVS